MCMCILNFNARMMWKGRRTWQQRRLRCWRRECRERRRLMRGSSSRSWTRSRRRKLLGVSRRNAVHRFLSHYNSHHILHLLMFSVQSYSQIFSPGWKQRRSSRRKTKTKQGGNTSRMNICGENSSSWWRTWTKSSSLGLEVSRKSHGPSPFTETLWSLQLLLWGWQVSIRNSRITAHAVFATHMGPCLCHVLLWCRGATSRLLSV